MLEAGVVAALVSAAERKPGTMASGNSTAGEKAASATNGVLPPTGNSRGARDVMTCVCNAIGTIWMVGAKELSAVSGPLSDVALLPLSSLHRGDYVKVVGWRAD